MKYSIYINQFCWEKNDFKSLDIIDLALFDAIRCFMISSKAETIVIDRQVYYWVSPNILIKEMPILGITTPRGVNKRLENLIDAKLLERCPDNQSIKRSYFKMGEKYNLYMCNSDENENSSLGTNVPTRTWTDCSKDNNTIIDKNTNKETIINNSKEKEPKVKFADFVSMTNAEYEKLSAELGESGVKECVDILNNYKGSKGKTYKSDYLAIHSWVIDKYKEKKEKALSPQFRQSPLPQNNSLPKWKAMGFNSQEEYLKAFGK